MIKTDIQLMINFNKKKWSTNHASCVGCGSIDQKHVARGLCKTCYQRENAMENNEYIRQKRGVADDFLTKEKLHDLYFNSFLSFGEISKIANTSRANISYKFKKYGFVARAAGESRNIALSKGKFDNKEHKPYNKAFFDSWSNEMAYCLGLLFTDGNVSKNAVITFSQKDIELVEKFANMIDYRGKMYFRKERKSKTENAGECYVLQIGSKEIANKLLEYGITANKSLTIKFPSMPNSYVRHFIRGCWDGDGTIYKERATGKYRAKFISGSVDFINTMKTHLRTAGLSYQNTHKHPTANAYSFQYTSISDLCKLFSYLYDGVDESQYLRRKYMLFETSGGVLTN
jgi:hypothetical protein